MVRSSKTRISLDRSGISTQESMSNQTSYSQTSSPNSKYINDTSTSSSKQTRKDNRETSLMLDYEIPKFRQKKSWKALSPYSKQLLLHYVRRAKNNCMLTIPDSRKEDILDLYNRVVHSSLNVIDTKVFPESPYPSDLTDVTYINTSIQQEKKQNTLLLQTYDSIEKETEKEKEKQENLEQERIHLQREIDEYESEIQQFKNKYPETHLISTRNKEIQAHRENAHSIWRQLQNPELYNENPLLDELQDVTAKRFENEKPLRSVIKRMTVIDESIQL